MVFKELEREDFESWFKAKEKLYEHRTQRALWLATVRGIFEYVLPVIVGAYAIWILVF